MVPSYVQPSTPLIDFIFCVILLKENNEKSEEIKSRNLKSSHEVISRTMATMGKGWRGLLDWSRSERSGRPIVSVFLDASKSALIYPPSWRCIEKAKKCVSTSSSSPPLKTPTLLNKNACLPIAQIYKKKRGFASNCSSKRDQKSRRKMENSCRKFLSGGKNRCVQK